MRRPGSRVVAVLAGLLAAALGGLLLLLLPAGVFEAPAGPLDRLVPARASVAVRFDPRALLASETTAALWRQPGVADLRARLGLDAALGPLRDAEREADRALAGVPGAPDAARDLLGRETVVARVDGEALVLARVGAAAKWLDLLGATLEGDGLRVEGDRAVASVRGGGEWTLARHRDVLVASTSRRLLDEVLAAAPTGGRSLAGRAGFADALRIGKAPGERLLGFADPAALIGRGPLAEGAAEFWGGMLAPRQATALRFEVTLHPRGADVLFEGRYDELPAPLADLVADTAPAASALAEEARRFAVPGEAAVVVGVAARAAAVVELLFESQPPARRDLVRQVLAEAGESPDSVAAELGLLLEDGMGAVVARLAEADLLALDEAGEGAVYPIPATLVVFRLREGVTEEQVLESLDRRREELFGGAPRAAARRVAGARVHPLTEHALGLEWDLFRPAVAFLPGRVVVSTHAGYLRRALERHAAGGGGGASDASRTLAVEVRGEALRRHVDDLRWEHAEHATWHDWRAERLRIRAEQDLAEPPLPPEERVRAEDREIEARIRRRAEVEFPAAVAAWRERWRWLEDLGTASVRADLEGPRFSGRAELRLPD